MTKEERYSEEHTIQYRSWTCNLISRILRSIGERELGYAITGNPIVEGILILIRDHRHGDKAGKSKPV